MRDLTPSATRKPYESPRLTRCQSLAEITAAKKKMSPGEEEPPPPCWVARAVYGEENPRWVLFRAWLQEDAPAWLRALYLRHGRAFAPLVVRQRWLAAGLRPLMDRAIAAKFQRR
jgi:hypothetical protein